MADELEQLKKQQAEIQRQIDLETAKLQDQKNQTATQTHARQETYNGRTIEYRNNEYKINSVIQGFKTIEQAKDYIDDLSKSAPSVEKNNGLSANEKKWIGILLIVFIFFVLFIFAKKNSDDNNLMNFNNPPINQTNKNNLGLTRDMIYQVPTVRNSGNCYEKGATCIDDYNYEKLCRVAEGFTKQGFRTSADAYFAMGDYLAQNGDWTDSSIKWQKLGSNNPSECIARLTLEGYYKGNSVRWKSFAVVEQFLVNEEGKVLVHRSDFKFEEN